MARWGKLIFLMSKGGDTGLPFCSKPDDPAKGYNGSPSIFMTRISTDDVFKMLARRAVEIAHQHGHELVPGVLSAMMVMHKIFKRFEKEHDLFVLSKGHASPALYSFMEHLGYSPKLDNMFPQRDPENGITCTTGSLGHGLPLAVGLAMAKVRRQEPGIVYVLMGDGECLEGTTWESLCVASQFNLYNLQVHVDGNGCASLGGLPINCAPKLPDIFPDLVTYHKTVKGAGLSFLEGTTEHKYKLSQAEFEQAMEDLKV